MTSYGGNGFGYKSVAFGTVINRLLPPRPSAVLRVTKLKATGANATHKVTALRSLGKTKANATSIAAATTVTLLADPSPSGNTLAANDLLAIREIDGVTRLYTVSTFVGLVVTLTAGLTAGVTASASPQCSVWMLGVAADTDPRTGEAHPYFQLPAAAQDSWEDREGGIVAGIAADEPILLQHSNATATGSLDQVSYSYTTL